MSLTGEQALGAARKIVKKEMHKVYRPAGTKTVAELTFDLLVAENLGNVYNAADSGVTTSDFVEGPGKTINAGDNIDIVDIGSGDTHVYKFDLYMGADLSTKADKVSNATAGHLAGLDASGNLTDSGYTVDSTPTANSSNPVSSGGVYTALESKANTADLGTAASKDSTNAVTSGSTALVESGAVYTALANKTDNTIIVSDIESTTTASKAYAVDEYLMLNNILYKVTSAISSGGTIVTSGASANVIAVKITDEMRQGGGADITILAPEFNTTTAYGVGDYVTYNGSLYRFKSSHSSGAWNSSHVVEIKAVGQYVTAGKLSGSILGTYATAEGSNTSARGGYSHAEGYNTSAIGNASHAEGWITSATGQASHAGGYGSSASGYYSHAEGCYTKAQRRSQTAIGEYNKADTTGADGTDKGKYVFIIGNGTANNARSNALTVDWDGNLEIAGSVIANGVTYIPTFIGTTAQWNALSSTEKNKYTVVMLTDD